MAESAGRRRKEKRDLTMAIILAIVFFIATLFLKVTLAGIAGFVCLFAIAGYVGNLERMVGIKRKKVVAIQAVIIIFGSFIEIALLYPVWRKEMASATEGDLLGANEDFGDGQFRMIPPVQLGKEGTKIFQPPGSQPFWKPFPDAEFRAEAGKKGPMVSTTIRDADGHIVASIDKNKNSSISFAASCTLAIRCLYSRLGESMSLSIVSRNRKGFLRFQLQPIFYIANRSQTSLRTAPHPSLTNYV